MGHTITDIINALQYNTYTLQLFEEGLNQTNSKTKHFIFHKCEALNSLLLHDCRALWIFTYHTAVFSPYFPCSRAVQKDIRQGKAKVSRSAGTLKFQTVILCEINPWGSEKQST